MDPLSFIGIILGLGAVVGGNFLEGGHISSLLNGPAIVIVFGGTLGAVLLQTPLRTFVYAVKALKWVFMPPAVDKKGQIKKIVGWSTLARREGLLGLEAMVNAEKDVFARKGLQMLHFGTVRKITRHASI